MWSTLKQYLRLFLDISELNKAFFDGKFAFVRIRGAFTTAGQQSQQWTVEVRVMGTRLVLSYKRFYTILSKEICLKKKHQIEKKKAVQNSKTGTKIILTKQCWPIRSENRTTRTKTIYITRIYNLLFSLKWLIP